MFTHVSPRPGLIGTLVAGLVATPLALGLTTPPAQANPAGTGLVVKEVYGAGGNSGAVYNADFVELYNPTAAAIALTGKTLQYRSASGSVGGTVTLTGTVAASGHFLVQMSAAGATGAALPTPDQTASPAIGMAAAGGQVILGTGTTYGTGDLAAASGVIDAFGTLGATSYEGAPAGAAASATLSLNRTATGGDTDSNAADFTTAAPSPTASGLAPDPEPTGPTAATIAEVQGTGATSPLAGTEVVTTGVVTALYPGTFNGFYLQTGGTGGPTDATTGASDAVFVYGGSDFDNAQGLALGDSVQVTGTVSEFAGQTQVTAAGSGIEELGSALAPVTPLVAAYPTTTDAREAHEGELLAPTDAFTVTNVYSTNQYGEIGLATGDKPLLQPTDVASVGTPEYDAVVADNAARAVTLDDGASINFLPFGGGANQDIPLPWLTPTRSVRVDSAATLVAPVILDYRNNTWKFQPQQQVTDDGADVATFEDTRAANLAPAAVGGDLRLGTFNVLNYFPTTGHVFESRGGSCTYYTDRQADPVTVNTCTPNGPRGAAELGDLRRQQAKIVNAINTMDADIVSLEEIENSIKMLGETDRDAALKKLVTALNDAAGTRRWAFVPSPAAADLPPVASQDVIRTAFIYDPAAVNPVGASRVLVGSTAFTNARQPLAQAFKPVGAGADAAFSVVVNHFKSKGDSTPAATGDNANGPQGAFNGDRVRQAQALTSFAQQFAADRGTEAVFLTGDFNAYSQEAPVTTLEAAGYSLVESDDADDYSYSFSGYSGSLDHVFANDAAKALVTGADVWEINADEPIAYQYSRRNYNVTQFFDASDPFAASDHNPEIVGFTAPDGTQTEINLLNINDFHGRIDANTTKFATTVEQLRAEGGEDKTLFLSAGDNIGASLFASSIDQDEPTIDVLNALQLRASALGNHELDRGFADLTGRVSDSADWDYLAANVYQKGTTTPALDQYDTFVVDGVTVGVIGAVTQETPTLVSPGGIADLSFGDPVEAVNRVAAQLSDGDDANGEADVIVAEFHEGAGAGIPDGATLEDEVAQGGAFASIVNDTSAEVDAIFTGHTHKQYAWDGPVPGQPGRTRPILQTGSYGENVGQIKLTVDPATGTVVSYTERNVARAATADLGLPRVQQVKTITDAALANAAAVGNQPIGQVTDDITTAFSGGSYGADGYTGGSRDDRAAESTLGGLVANALRDGVSDFAEPDLGLTNSGGLRAELLFAGNTSTGGPNNTDGTVTYAEANAVLPFNNTVAIVDLTGAQLKAVLEQQWQTDAEGNIPSRPYAQLGMSDNVAVVADPSQPAGSRIVSVRIDGEPLDPAATYTVSTLSFLAQGGDNFRAFTEASYVDTGLLDAQLWRDYLADNAPLSPDFARQQVFVDGLGDSLVAGKTSTFTLGRPAGGPLTPITGTTLDLTSLGSPANTSVTATLTQGGTETPLGDFAVTDGTAAVTIAVPAGAAGGVVTFVAQPSGTTVTVPVVDGGTTPPAPEPVVPTLTVRHTPATVIAGRTRATLSVVVRSAGAPATGYVQVRVAGKTFVRKLEDGRISVRLPRFATPGVKTVFVKYGGNATTQSRTTTHTIRVVRR
ncbi:ExeM/NucH family extracellular endonuclease [Nocardioides rubriscoriae]|uniref:ExeM/NucH family extracellular endonuclease n=1 Tax=Nocardioides rubriscoriae TaxID=642762 RepID=UPI0014787FC3|nr:ExeM/NucH family extracellular endonuclease [Nocardioides rubriscoriae]